MKFKTILLTTALPAVMVAASLSTAQAATLDPSQFGYGAERPSTAFTADRKAPATLFNAAETRTQIAQSTTTPKTGSKTQSDAQRRAEQAKEAEAQRNKQRIEAAKPLNEADVAIKQIMGADVRNTKYAQVATVEDLKLKDGKISEVVIATGGFLGLGASYYQVSMDKARIYADKDTTFVLIDVDKDTIKQFAEVEQKDDQWVPVAKQAATDKPDAKAPADAPKKGQTDSETKTPEPTEKKDGEQKQ